MATQDLRIGMFVTELDRPWLESPFLMQGFLVEDQETLEQVRRECRFVYVDRSRSAGDAWRAIPVEKSDPPLDRATALSSFQVPPEVRRQPLDFFALLRSLRALSGRGVRDSGVAADASSAPWFHRYPDVSGGASHTVPEEETPGNLADPFGTSRPLVTENRRSGRPPSPARTPAEQSAAAGGPTGMAYVQSVVPLEEEIVVALPMVTRAHALLEQIARDVQSSLNPDLEPLRGVVSEMVLSVARNPDALLWLVRLKQTDQYSYDHSLDVAAHVMEYLIFKAHVDYSLQILSASPQATPQILEIVGRHHERCDGSGYPNGLRGAAVGLLAEAAGICDVYCAMTRERPYGEAASSQVALDTVRAGRGITFSESTVDQFVQCIGLYPVGTLVELNSGEVAVVVAQNRIRRLKPRVMILLGPDKKPNAYPKTLDLLYDPPSATGEPYVISRALQPGAFGVDPSEFYLA
ncbi:MAG: DUF3391 domain-containing protein [Zoogloea sp.]|nr:DUF3391 domain-containing protein [Zoogloea sp.]